ncbi:putative motility protein [Leptolinea tardivitalis]|nr:putative motility protein [Leptolinea tardivitalis]
MHTTDKKNMINSISSESSLASYATGSKNRAVMNEISMAIMKQTMDQQKAAGQALIEMIKQSPMPDGTGQLLNKAA